MRTLRNGAQGHRGLAGSMRIVVVMHSHALGGAERHVLTLLDGLRARGHQAHFAGPRNGWLGEQVRSLGIPVLHLGMHGMYDALSALKLGRYLRQIDADLVHGHSMRGTRYAVWAGARAGVPAVGTAHSTTAGRWLQGAQRIIPVSAAVLASLREQGYGEELEAPVYPGVPDNGVLTPAQRSARRAAFGLAPQDQALVMLGRLVPEKGHDLAIAALRRLGDLPVKLFLYGDGDAEWIAQLRAQIEREQLQTRVQFLGRQDDACRTLGTFDIFLQPSRREALSLSLLEASAQALPIIASEVGGIPEIVHDRETGLLVPTDDADRLAESIRSLIQDRPAAQRLGAAARRQYLQQFTVTAMMSRIEAVYARARPRVPPCADSGGRPAYANAAAVSAGDPRRDSGSRDRRT